MAFPYAKLQNQPLLTALKPFPKSHEDLINQWWGRQDWLESRVYENKR